MDAHPFKRHKPEVITLGSDSDSDDDIVITGVRQLQPGATNVRQTQALATPFVTQPALHMDSPMSHAHSTNGNPYSNALLNTAGHMNPLNSMGSSSAGVQAAKNGPIPGTLKVPVGAHVSSGVNRPDLIQGFAKPEPGAHNAVVQPKLENVLMHRTGVIEFNGHLYNSRRDVVKREQELLKRVKKYQAALETIERKTRERPQKSIGLKKNRDNLLRMGISKDSKKIVELEAEMTKLSEEARQHDLKKKQYADALRKSENKLKAFVRGEKPSVMKAVEVKEAKEREAKLLEQQRRAEKELQLRKQREEQVKALNAQRMGVAPVNGMAAMMQNALDTMRGLIPQHRYDRYDDMYDDYEDDDGDERAFSMRRIHEQQARHTRNMMANPYASSSGMTQDDIAHMLESLKKQEETGIDGESNTPDELTVNLLKHQRIGLRWLEDAEDDKKKRGGILADAMGLGKTVQLIALMLSHRAEKNEDEDATPYGKTNLIVAPVSLINQWEAEVQQKVKESTGLRTLMYHSMGGKKVSFSQMKEYDVVLTSYGTLSSELQKHCNILEGTAFDLKTPPSMNKVNQLKDGKGYISPFFSEESSFYRVILDEAQHIKNKFTKVSVSVSCLKSFYSWCLSGTPMQNNVDELYPLIRFVGIRPYNDEGAFRADIGLPLDHKSRKYDEVDRENATKKLRILLRTVMLRREKNSTIDGKPILELPEKKVIVEHTEFSTNKAEENFYRSIENSAKEKVTKLLDRKNVAKGDYNYIFTLLLRLRQACLHSELVRIGDRRKGVLYDDEGNVISTATVDSMCKNAERLKPDVVKRINEKANDDGFQCPLCLEDVLEEEVVIFFPCGHSVCRGCCTEYFESKNEGEGQMRHANCLSCNQRVKENEVIDYEVLDKHINKNQSVEMIRIVYDERKKDAKDMNAELQALKVDELEFSPKIAGLIKLLKDIWEKKPEDKVIVFSHFTSFFQIASKFLNKSGIESMHYVGSMNANTRNLVVKEFYANDAKKLMLISLKAGNSGLTLTCANHVVIMDPFWNPYVELQAQDRCHRIGQLKPVNVYRMLIKGTVEDRILELQEKKKEIIEAALDPTGMKEASKLSREDIRRLFNINNR